jgi:hypothetical protein
MHSGATFVRLPRHQAAGDALYGSAPHDLAVSTPASILPNSGAITRDGLPFAAT